MFRLKYPASPSRPAGLIVALSVICAIVLTACSGQIKPAPNLDPLRGMQLSFVPPEYQKQFSESLALAGDNRAELIKTLESVAPEMRKGAAFLIAHLSYPDVAAIKSDVLIEHIKYAYLVRAKYPWVKDMPEEVFLHYVLPYRCAEEPIEAYRKYFYEQLDPIVGQLDNMADVVHQVNLWLGAPKSDPRSGGLTTGKSRFRFVQTEARDQGPITSLKSGYGRCEEMMIIYMCAARSVGIPCRSAWTPYWPICDNNHAWVEVWVDGNWKPIGGCEPGTPWFEHPAKRAAAVYSAAIGLPKSEIIHKSFGTSSMINSTPNYSKTCTVNVTVSKDNKPVSDVTTAFAVFNWGSFRPVATKITNSEGRVTFIMGIGEYFLSAGNDSGRAWQVVKTEPDKTLELAMKLEPDAVPDGFLFLRYPTVEQAMASFSTATVAPVHLTLMTPTRLAPPEIYFFDEFSPALHSDILELVAASPERDAVVQKLISAGGNWPEIAGAIKEIKPELRNDLLWLISQLAHLEAIEVTKEFLLDNVNFAAYARPRVRIQIPDDIYRPYVLNPSFQYLHISNWRAELSNTFVTILPTEVRMRPPSRGKRGWVIFPYGPITETARAANEWVNTNIKIQGDMRGRFSYLASPMDTLRSKQGDGYGVAVFTAALLRTLGVPAKVKNDWVEFYDGSQWLPLYPHDPKNFANIQRNETTAKEYTVQPSGLKMNLLKKGVVDTNPWEKIAISRFQNGYWGYLDELPRHGRWTSIPSGAYLVTAGVRNANGDAMVYCKQLTFKPGEGIVIDLPMDIPLGAMPESERVVRKLDAVPDFELADLDGKIYKLHKILEDSSVMLAFFSLDNEPSIRMLPMIDQLKEKAGQSNVVMLAVYIDSEGKDKFLKDDRLKSLRIPVLLDTDQKAARQFIPDLDKDKAKCLPSTLLIRGNPHIPPIYSKLAPSIRVWDEGYNMAIGALLDSALELLTKPGKDAATKPAEPKISYQPFSIGPDYTGEGDRYFKEGNYPKAIEAYLNALKLNQDDAGTWYNLACTYSLANRVDDGLDALKKSIGYGWSELHWMDNDPDLTTLRKDPRYRELRK